MGTMLAMLTDLIIYVVNVSQNSYCNPRYNLVYYLCG